MTRALTDYTATELVREYRRRALSPVEVTRAVLQRIADFDGTVNAFRLIDDEGALAAAKESEARWLANEPKGLLDGVPVSIKDLLLSRGLPTSFGSRTTDLDQPWEVDSPCAARLRENGAIILGKTTTSEFGYKIVTDSPLSGITRNPWNLERTPGGSSGGAAVAVATGMGPLAIGTDGGGSIRIPANWTGVFGFKPTFRRVPAYPNTNFGTLSNVGPLTRTVEDAALAMTTISRPDSRDWHALPYDGRDYRVGLGNGVEGLRIAFSPDMGFVEVEPAIAQCARRSIEVFEQLGARVEVIEPPISSRCREVHSAQWMVTVAALVRTIPTEKRDLLDPGLLELAALGEEVSTAAYHQALLEREALGQTMHLFFRNFDLLLLPTFHVTAPRVPGVPTDLQEAPRLTSWCNQTMQPAASIPCGVGDEGIPVGLQVVGPRYADALVLRACRAYEAARGAFPVPTLAVRAEPVPERT